MKHYTDKDVEAHVVAVVDLLIKTKVVRMVGP